MNSVDALTGFRRTRARLLLRQRVAFGQCASQPPRGDLRHRSRICRADVIDQLAQRSGISFPIHFYECAPCFCLEIVWLDSQYAIEVRFLFSITPEGSVTISEAVERVNVARVELKCPLEISSRFFPVPLTPLDVTR